jgi:hypothetical protein
MNLKFKCIFLILIFSKVICIAQQRRGASLPWTTYEAEQMKTTGAILGPKYEPYLVETESSGQQCVKLDTKGQSVEFKSTENANSIVVRYSLPDNKTGSGTKSTLAFYKNGTFIERYKISSHYTWLYGKYSFTNNPADGKPRNFYDELRIKSLKIKKGDVIKIQSETKEEDDATYCIIDLVDLENVAPPLNAPPNSLSITDKSFMGNIVSDDYTEAFRNCIAKAKELGKTVWIPAGTFKITGKITLPSGIKIQGAGMWYSELVGDEAEYADVNKRVSIAGNGSDIHIADFAIIGKLNYRSDRESSDGIGGSFGENSTITNIWVEHTKVGMWIENSKNLTITGCRMRNTLADGINFCVGMTQSTIQNCTARGTGDDCFAIWPTVYSQQKYSPGQNLISHCTGQLPFLANGAAIYGGKGNKVKDCLFTDISQGSAILISTTFPTESKDKTINNNFSDTTLVENCDIKRSGGFDHEWDWRASVEICLDKRNISGVLIKNINIENSLSNGVSVIAKNEPDKVGILSAVTLTNVNVLNYGIGTADKHALFISSGAHGSLTIEKSKISDIKNESVTFGITK